MVLQAAGIVFACIFLDDSCVMPFHALLLGFRMKMKMIVTSHDAMKKVFTFDSTPFQQLRENIFFDQICASSSASEEPTR